MRSRGLGNRAWSGAGIAWVRGPVVREARELLAELVLRELAVHGQLPGLPLLLGMLAVPTASRPSCPNYLTKLTKL